MPARNVAPPFPESGHEDAYPAGLALTSGPGISLVIAVYNKAEVLRLVLAACARQSFTDFEVIIADDGSGPHVGREVEEARKAFSFPILHLWHEDRGWRKNTILNMAIRSARADYLVFIDGDCIPGKDFLLDHWNNRERGKVLMGRRAEMSERWSNLLTLGRIRDGSYDRIGWSEFLDGLKGDALRVEDGIRIPSRILRTILLRKLTGMLGSNFSVAREHLVAINGFDELYAGPGCGEDSDIQFRLSLIGVTGKSIRNLAIQYHVFHAPTKTSQASWDRFQEVKARREPRCGAGLELLREATR